MMTIKMLIPTDGSDNSNIALNYGIYIAPKFDATITGLHVIDVSLIQGPIITDISGAVGMPPYDGFFEAIETSLNEKAQFILKDFQERCKKNGIVAEVKKTIGKIEQIIVEEAQGADVVLMAKKGEHFHLKEGGLLGTVAESVIRRCGKPVMVTPEKFTEIESMGIAYDGSEPAKKALKLSLEISSQAAWPLTAIIITADSKKADKLSNEAEELAGRYSADCEIIILQGKEFEEILKFIREGSVELMVMGAYGHNRLRELFLGSTTTQIIRKSSVPVLLTR
jgi:nucleotide-binding universal stress UspA family protein